MVSAMTITTARLTPDPQRFPPGTNVSAYRSSAWSSSDRSVAPTGAADVGPVAVAADGSLTFTGLTDQTTYFAWAAGTGAAVRFSTRHDYADDLAQGVGSTSSVATITRDGSGVITAATDATGTVDTIVRDSNGLASFHENGVARTITRNGAGQIVSVA